MTQVPVLVYERVLPPYNVKRGAGVKLRTEFDKVTKKITLYKVEKVYR